MNEQILVEPPTPPVDYVVEEELDEDSIKRLIVAHMLWSSILFMLAIIA